MSVWPSEATVIPPILLSPSLRAIDLNEPNPDYGPYADISRARASQTLRRYRKPTPTAPLTPQPTHSAPTATPDRTAG